MVEHQIRRLEKKKSDSTGFNATVLGIGDLADRAVPSETCVATIHRAMDFGLNLIDTAPGYENGYCEAIPSAAVRGRRGAYFGAYPKCKVPKWHKVKGKNRQIIVGSTSLDLNPGCSHARGILKRHWA